MSERFIKIFLGNENLYTDGAPVVIRANALLKDTQTGRMIAQLKLQNISGKCISYVKVAITQIDAIKKPIGEVISFEYLDLSASDKEEFGSKKPLPLPNVSTRSFFVGVSHVGFSDGSIWSSDNTDWQGVEKDSNIVKMLESEDIYKKAVELSKGKNNDDVEKAKELFESIGDIKDVAIEIQMCNQKLSEIQELAKAKKKKITVGFSVSLALVVFILIGYFAIYPLVSYMSGNYQVYIDMYNVKEFEVPDGVTSIDDYEFFLCRSLTSITIPDSVTSIGNNAFRYCSSLTSITIPNSVTSIGKEAFYGCSSLASITIPDSVTSIGEGAFHGCSRLISIAIPCSVTSISSDMFSWCERLTNIIIPKSVTSIGDGAFDCCDKLKTIYYEGSRVDWRQITLYRNPTLENTIIYYYSEASKSGGKYWHYVDGVPTLWG